MDPQPAPSGATPEPREDFHVHTQFSWDAPRGDMAATCRAALDLGLTAVAFTEHADFDELATDPRAVVDICAYLDAVDDCRQRFAALRIYSGVELGQPNLYPEETVALLGAAGRPLDRVLGSMHVAELDGRLVDVSGAARQVAPARMPELVRSSLRMTDALVASDAPFHILAHLEYAKRYWPHDALTYDPLDFEEEFRTVLSAAAARRLVLEINTTRGGPAHRALGPGPVVLRWWHEAGGQEVSFGSDAHQPVGLAGGFAAAAELAATAGFHPRVEVGGIWGRATR